MLIGARLMGATDAKSYDVQDYVGWGTNDLLCCYDGIRNVDATSPHSTSAATWKDLVSGAALTKYSSAIWGDNCRVYSGGNEYRNINQAMVDAFNGQNYTIEFIVKPDSNTGADWLCFGDGPGSVRDRIQGNASGWVRYIQNAPGYTIVWKGSWRVPDILHICAMQDNSTSGRIFYNGVKSSITRDFVAPTWSTSLFLDIANEPAYRNNSLYCLRGSVYAMRMYGRALTDAEAADNYAVDKARFGLI